jgi:hypothetical protein
LAALPRYAWLARLTNLSWMTRCVADAWGRSRTLSPQAAAGMVCAVVDTMSSAVSVSFPVSEPRRGEHSQEGDGEPGQECGASAYCPVFVHSRECVLHRLTDVHSVLVGIVQAKAPFGSARRETPKSVSRGFALATGVH